MTKVTKSETVSTSLPRSGSFSNLARILREGRMKRLFNPRKKSDGEPAVEQGSTLDRIVKDKEGVKKRLEEEEREFLTKKREAERKMIEFEKQEVLRREQEIVEKNQALVEIKRKNQLVQDKVTEQIKMLHMKLEELRTEHKCNETSTENVIASLTDKLAEVQQSLSHRVEAFAEDEDNFPSAPAYREGEDPGDVSPSTGLYPALPAQAGIRTMPRSISLHHVQHDQTDGVIRKEGGSLGSSPQISLTSTGSSRSITPRLDSDTSI